MIKSQFSFYDQGKGKPRSVQEGHCTGYLHIYHSDEAQQTQNTPNYAELQTTLNTSRVAVQKGNGNREKHVSSITLKIQFWR